MWHGSCGSRGAFFFLCSGVLHLCSSPYSYFLCFSRSGTHVLTGIKNGSLCTCFVQYILHFFSWLMVAIYSFLSSGTPRQKSRGLANGINCAPPKCLLRISAGFFVPLRWMNHMIPAAIAARTRWYDNALCLLLSGEWGIGELVMTDWLLIVSKHVYFSTDRNS
jgi:hypothetical protein